MTGLKISDESKDLTNPNDLAVLTDPNSIKGTVKVFQIEKAYSETRADEVFGMMYQSGCQPASKAMFGTLASMYQKSL